MIKKRKKKITIKQPHSQLVTSIVDVLIAKGFHAYENDNPGRWRADIKAFLKGKTPGKPDIMGCFLNGILFYIEAKVRPDHLRDDQVLWFRECKRRGIPCFCAYSVDEVIKWLKDGDYTIQAYGRGALNRIKNRVILK